MFFSFLHLMVAMLANNKGEDLKSFLSNRALRIEQGISDYKNNEVFSKLLKDNRKQFYRSVALNASRSPIEVFRHAAVAKGWYQSGIVQYRISSNVFNETTSIFKGLYFSRSEKILGVIPKKDQIFTGQVFRDEINKKLFRVSKLIAHVNSVDCYSVHPVEIDSIVHDFNFQGSSPLGVDAGCSGTSGGAGCYISLNWENVPPGQDPSSVGAIPINKYGVDIFLGAYIHGEIGLTAKLRAVGSSTIDFYFSYGYTAQVGFALKEIFVEDITLKTICVPVPKLHYGTTILGIGLEIGVSVCGELGISNLRFVSNTTLSYKRTVSAENTKHISISTSGTKTYPDKYSYQTLFDSNINSGTVKDFFRKATLEFTPEIRLYGKLVVTFIKKLVDLRAGIALGTPFKFTFDFEKCPAPALIGNIGVVFRVFVTFAPVKILFVTVIPEFKYSLDLLRIDSLAQFEAGGKSSSSEKCFVSPYQNSYEMNENYRIGQLADLMLVHADSAYWLNDGPNKETRWLGNFPLNLNTYLNMGSIDYYVSTKSFGNIGIDSGNNFGSPSKIDRIVVIRDPLPNYDYYFQIIDGERQPESGTQLHGRPFESEKSFANIIIQNGTSNVRADSSQTIQIIYHAYPSNETIFGKESPVLNQLRNTYNDTLPKAFGSFTVSRKAIQGDKFALIQHNDSTPYICDPTVLYIDSVSQSVKDFELGQFSFVGLPLSQSVKLDYTYGSGKALMRIIWSSKLVPFSMVSFKYLEMCCNKIGKANNRIIDQSYLNFSINMITKTDTYAICEIQSFLYASKGWPLEINFDDAFVNYSLILNIELKVNNIIMISSVTFVEGILDEQKLREKDFTFYVDFNSQANLLVGVTGIFNYVNVMRYDFSFKFEAYTSNFFNFSWATDATSEVAFMNVENIPGARRIIAQLYEMEYIESPNPPWTSFNFLDGAIYVVLKLIVGEKLLGQNRIVFSCDNSFTPLCDFSWVSRDTVIVSLDEGINKFSQQKIINIPIRFNGFTGVSSGNFHTEIRFRIFRLFYGNENSLCSPSTIIKANGIGFFNGDFGCVEHPRTNDSYVAEVSEVRLSSSFSWENIEQDWRINCWFHQFTDDTEVFIFQNFYVFPDNVPSLTLNSFGITPIIIHCSRCSSLQNDDQLIVVHSEIATFIPKVETVFALCDSFLFLNCISNISLGNSSEAYLIKYEQQGLVVDMTSEINDTILESFLDQQIFSGQSNLIFYKDWAGKLTIQPIDHSDKFIIFIQVILITKNTLKLTPFVNGFKIPFSHQKYSDGIILEDESNISDSSDISNSSFYNFSSDFLENLSFVGIFNNIDFYIDSEGFIVGPVDSFKGDRDSWVSSDLFDLPQHYVVHCVGFEIDNLENRCKTLYLNSESDSKSTALIVSLVVIGSIIFVGACILLFFILKKKCYSNDNQDELEEDIQLKKF